MKDGVREREETSNASRPNEAWRNGRLGFSVLALSSRKIENPRSTWVGAKRMKELGTQYFVPISCLKNSKCRIPYSSATFLPMERTHSSFFRAVSANQIGRSGACGVFVSEFHLFTCVCARPYTTRWSEFEANEDTVDRSLAYDSLSLSPFFGSHPPRVVSFHRISRTILC